MIPLELRITNFLSYRDTAVLDLRGIHLACISGSNGAGKSSILDAITWALFGQSRSKSDDDLVNRLASRMDEAAEVNLIFDLEGSVYRVTRRKRAGKSTVLELQLGTDQDADGRIANWKPLSESKIRETQAAIETLLRMNYDSFINASFLLQGKADEFTTKSPSKRKDVLAELLGLSVWDEYREKAATQRKQMEGQIGLIVAQMEEIERELAAEPERQAKVAEMEAKHDAIRQQLTAQETILTELRRVETAVKQQQQHITNLTNTRSRTQQGLANQERTRAQRSTERSRHQALLDDTAKIEASYAAWQAASQTVAAWQEKANAHHQFERQLAPLRLTIAETRSRLEQQQQSLRQQETRASAATAEIETVQQAIANSQTQLKTLADQAAQLAKQTEAWQEAKARLQTLHGERTLLEQEAQRLQTDAKRMQQQARQQTAVRQNASDAQKQIAALTSQLADVMQQVQQQTQVNITLQTLDAQQKSLKAEMERRAERRDRLQESRDSVCPLCGQPLSDDHRQQVVAEIIAEGTAQAEQYRANQKRVTDLQTELATLTTAVQSQPNLEKQQKTQQDRLTTAEAELAQIAQTLQAWQENGQARLTELEQQLGDATVIARAQAEVTKLETAVQQKSKLDGEQRQQQTALSQAEARRDELQRLLQEWADSGQAQLATVSQQLAQEQYAAEARTALADLSAQQTAVAYDEAAHKTAVAERAAHQDAPEAWQALQQAQTAIQGIDTHLADLDAQIASGQETVAELTGQIDAAEVELAALQASGSDLQQVEDGVQTLREAEAETNRALGAARQTLAVLDDQRQRLTKMQGDQKEKIRQLQRLKMLEEACSRNGVPSLLIEEAIPSIEERANELLERLTGGAMHISFQTQRQLKSRDALRETLDIQISDTAGERPYDNYSGGEQFRVNFAIRLALSQTLARRAGARLQTLVIDEGFGSQDPNGRQRLVEAINTIQNDFERILIITHIDELRDAFPTRIEVEKTLNGSTINVI